ncbi:MAG: MBL fold metallo-hydrolase [Armatimonadetes bacterium]|nr:MBL fold metallo-hydrolase [Armatimonadota bacterium]
MQTTSAIVLGSGTSTGVPVLGIEYPAEFLANRKNHRTRPSLLLQGPTGNLLIDCGPDLRDQLLRENVLDIEQVLITHTHADHIMGMDDLRSFCLKYHQPLRIYAYEQYQLDIKRVFAYAFADFPPGVEVPRFDLQEVPPIIKVGGLNVETLRVMHGPLPCVAVRVGDFAYVTDVSEIPAEAMSRLQGLKTLVLDAVRYKPHPNHFHFDRAIEVALQLGAKQTYFTHLSHDYDHDKVNSELPAGIELAFDGLRIPIGT